MTRMNEASVEYFTKVRPDPDGGGVLLIDVPDGVIARLGTRKRPPVRATFNGVTYRTTVAVYDGRSYIPARREIREAAGLRMRVTLEVDDEKRVVDVPSDLARGLRDAGMVKAFAMMSFSHQHAWVGSVVDASRPATRAARIGKVVEALRARASRS